VLNIASNSVICIQTNSVVRTNTNSLYSAASDVYGRLHSVSARCSCSDRLRRMKGRGSWLGSMLNKH